MAVTLLAALLPSYLLRYEFFGLPTTFLELATYAAALGFVFKILLIHIKNAPNIVRYVYPALAGLIFNFLKPKEYIFQTLFFC